MLTVKLRAYGQLTQGRAKLSRHQVNKACVVLVMVSISIRNTLNKVSVSLTTPVYRLRKFCPEEQLAWIRVCHAWIRVRH